MENTKYNDLSGISLDDLNIYRQNALITLQKLERLVGNRDFVNSYESRDFMFFSGVYNKLEEEMNNRIVEIVVNNE